MADHCAEIMESLGLDKVLCCPKDFMDGLRAIISEVVSGVMPKQVAQSQIDTISLNVTLEFLYERRVYLVGFFGAG